MYDNDRSKLIRLKMRDKQEKFKELAEKRVNKALTGLRLIGNLANRNTYDYTEKQADLIISTLEAEVKILRQKF